MAGGAADNFTASRGRMGQYTIILERVSIKTWKNSRPNNQKDKEYWEGRYSVTAPLTGKMKQHAISGTNKIEIEKRLRKVLVEVDEGAYIPPSKQTPGEWLDIWLDTYVKPSVKPLTVLNYTQHITNHIKPALGDTKLDG